MQLKHIVVDGRLVSYRTSRETGTKTILVVHGWGQSSALWEVWAARCPEVWRVLVPDLPGFGQSQFLDKNDGVETYARWLQQLVARLKLKDYWLVGHSAGGQIAAFGVAQHLLRPNRLILLAPALTRLSETSLPLSLRVFRVAAKLKPYLPKMWVNRISTGFDYAQASSEQKQILKRLVREDVTLLLSRINSPTLMVFGEKDKEILGQPKVLAGLVGGARMRVIYNAGHNMQLSHPEQLVEMVNHFSHVGTK